MTQTNAIEVRDLVTHYGPRLILDGVDMDVAYGEIMIIMGGSGSGKSTLLRHLLSLHIPTNGTSDCLAKISLRSTPTNYTSCVQIWTCLFRGAHCSVP